MESSNDTAPNSACDDCAEDLLLGTVQSRDSEGFSGRLPLASSGDGLDPEGGKDGPRVVARHTRAGREPSVVLTRVAADLPEGLQADAAARWALGVKSVH